MPAPIAAVIDRHGTVVAVSGTDVFRELPGDVSVPLPDGGRLVTRPSDDRAWYRLARAFVHEMRSPLGALVIYLDLLTSKVAPAKPEERPEGAGPRLLVKAEAQARRINELLESFLRAWAPTAEHATDLAAITHAVARFGEHEARRQSLKLETKICETAPIEGESLKVTDALVSSLLATFADTEGGEVRLGVAEEGPAVHLSLQSTPAPARLTLDRAQAAFEAAGARVERENGGIVAAFRRAGVAGTKA